MKVSRFEPHILAPLADNNDLDVFMKELEEESENVRASRPSAAAPDSEESGDTERTDQEVKRGLHRLVEALGRNHSQSNPNSKHASKKRLKKTKKDMALDRYEAQKSYDFNNFTHYSKIS